MCKLHTRLALLFLLALATLGMAIAASADPVNVPVKGIYLTQTTMEDTKYLHYLIDRSKSVGINTFVVDLEIPSKLYAKNVQLLKDAGITYVARVIVFPQGGHPNQIESEAYWEKRYHLMATAVQYGAQQIQLDYIRYNTKQPASGDNAKHIFKVVQYFRDKIPQDIPLQADVFGISSYGESRHIGQNLRMMAESVNALCPMVYPSHFEPFRVHAVTPYQTIYLSLKALKSQFDGKMPVKIYAYIEISNYRYALPGNSRHAYILSEMKAVRDAGANGYYVWSAHNKYDYLFNLLAELQKESPATQEKMFHEAVNQSTKIHTRSIDEATANGGKDMDEDQPAATKTKNVADESPATNAAVVSSNDKTEWAHAGTDDDDEFSAFPPS
jgi:hypothetical protein